MSQIDELVRAFRDDLSDAPPGAAERAAARLHSQPLPRLRRLRGPVRGRRWATALAAAGVAGLAGVLGVLFVASPKDAATGDRGSWGLDATVRVSPSGGSLGLAALTGQAVAAFNGRARAQGLVGVEAAAVSPGLMRVQAPETVRKEQLTGLLEFADARVYDTGDPLLQTTDPKVVERWLHDHSTPGETPGAWTLLPKRVDGDPPRVSVASREELVRVSGQRILRDYDIAAVPAGIQILASARLGPRQVRTVGGSYTIIRDDPVVRAEQITGARAVGRNGRRIVFDVTQAASVRLASVAARPGAKLVAVRFGRYDVQVLGAATTAPPAPGKSGSVDVAMRLDAFPESVVAAVAGGGGLQARLAVESTDTYGTPPPLAGDVPATLPPEIERSLNQLSPATVPTPNDPATDKVIPLPRDAVLHALQVSRANDSWDLFVARTSWNADVFWIVRDQTRDTPANHTDPRAASRHDGALACDTAPGRPVLTFCTNLQDASGRFIFHMVGRASPQVARVEVRYRSRAPDTAVVANGWWLASTPADRPGPTEVVALDSAGRVLASLTPP